MEGGQTLLREGREAGAVLDGTYRLVRLLGQGGMGTIYEAVHLGVERPVAIKFLNRDLAATPEARQRFEREAKAAGRIGHDNICEALDFGVDEAGFQFYVMPLLRGRSLALELRLTGPLPAARAFDIAGQALSALAAAHAAGLVHRDLKPGNIFLTTLGDRDDFVKVLDFGISKAIEGRLFDDDPETLTRSGAVLGTPHYMAPEQARGDKDLDGRVDLYALGVILYEMLTGRRPFVGQSHGEIFWKVWNEPVVPPRQIRPDLPPALQDIVLRAMARDRALRFPSTEAMRSALLDAGLRPGAEDVTAETSPAAASSPPSAREGSAATPLSRSRARRRRVLVAAAIAALLLSAATGLLAMTWPDQEAAFADPGLQERTRGATPLGAEVLAPALEQSRPDLTRGDVAVEALAEEPSSAAASAPLPGVPSPTPAPAKAAGSGPQSLGRRFGPPSIDRGQSARPRSEAEPPVDSLPVPVTGVSTFGEVP
jgi:serine/threonine-protein kinase